MNWGVGHLGEVSIGNAMMNKYRKRLRLTEKEWEGFLVREEPSPLLRSSQTGPADKLEIDGAQNGDNWPSNSITALEQSSNKLSRLSSVNIGTSAVSFAICLSALQWITRSTFKKWAGGRERWKMMICHIELDPLITGWFDCPAESDQVQLRTVVIVDLCKPSWGPAKLWDAFWDNQAKPQTSPTPPQDGWSYHWSPISVYHLKIILEVGISYENTLVNSQGDMRQTLPNTRINIYEKCLQLPPLPTTSPLHLSRLRNDFFPKPFRR